MKIRIFAIAIAFALTLSAFASPADEALESIETAKQFIQSREITKALDELNFAIAKLNEALSEKLARYLPENNLGGFSLGGKEVSSSAAMGMSGLTGTANYEHSDGSSIELTISYGGFLGKAGGLAALGSLYGGSKSSSGGATASRQFRQQGFTGTVEHNKSEKTGKVTLAVGENVTVLLEGRGLPSDAVLVNFLKNIDLLALSKEF